MISSPELSYHIETLWYTFTEDRCTHETELNDERTVRNKPHICQWLIASSLTAQVHIAHQSKKEWQTSSTISYYLTMTLMLIVTEWQTVRVIIEARVMEVMIVLVIMIVMVMMRRGDNDYNNSNYDTRWQMTMTMTTRQQLAWSTSNLQNESTGANLHRLAARNNLKAKKAKSISSNRIILLHILYTSRLTHAKVHTL